MEVGELGGGHSRGSYDCVGRLVGLRDDVVGIGRGVKGVGGGRGVWVISR